MCLPGLSMCPVTHFRAMKLPKTWLDKERIILFKRPPVVHWAAVDTRKSRGVSPLYRWRRRIAEEEKGFLTDQAKQLTDNYQSYQQFKRVYRLDRHPDRR